MRQDTQCRVTRECAINNRVLLVEGSHCDINQQGNAYALGRVAMETALKKKKLLVGANKRREESSSSLALMSAARARTQRHTHGSRHFAADYG